MLEVEVKVEVMVPATLRAALRAAGAQCLGVAQQEDTYFHHPGRDLAGSDEAFRLRRTPDVMELTYKGPRRSGDVKVREEHNVGVADDPTALLEALGFRRGPVLRKRREAWRMGGMEVAIDELDGLGVFAEVEVRGGDAGKAARRVEEALATLGLAGAPRHSMSYLEMALATGAGALQRDE